MSTGRHDTVTVTLIDGVLVSVPDTLQPILERIRAAHVATVADYETALASVEMRLAAAESVLARSEHLRQANLALAGQAGALRRWKRLRAGVRSGGDLRRQAGRPGADGHGGGAGAALRRRFGRHTTPLRPAGPPLPNQNQRCVRPA